MMYVIVKEVPLKIMFSISIQQSSETLTLSQGQLAYLDTCKLLAELVPGSLNVSAWSYICTAFVQEKWKKKSTDSINQQTEIECSHLEI